MRAEEKPEPELTDEGKANVEAQEQTVRDGLAANDDEERALAAACGVDPSDPCVPTAVAGGPDFDKERQQARLAGSEALGPDDNWKHRSSLMRCKTCMFFVPKVGEPDKFGMKVVRLGCCRKEPPTKDGWPVVYVSDWCGGHKLDENKA